jgi:hypothetical protein
MMKVRMRGLGGVRGDSHWEDSTKASVESGGERSGLGMVDGGPGGA